MARQHADAVADVLRSLDADVINLCEVQGCDELDYLKARLTCLVIITMNVYYIYIHVHIHIDTYL